MTLTPDYRSRVLEYFSAKAEEYDLVAHQEYWQLSDTLLWWALEQKVLRRLPGAFSFLDAGGGTGRWTERILRAFPGSRGHLFDLSPAMTRKMAERGRAEDLSGRFTITNGTLEDVASALAAHRFDLVFNFHNVLGFVGEPKAVVSQLGSLLKPGGWLVSFVPNWFHLIFFNLRNGNLAEAERAAATNRGRFTFTMPDIHLFSPASVVELYESGGLRIEVLTGFPSAIYPGLSETALRGSSESIRAVLGDPEGFARVLAIEKKLMEAPDVAARGNNLLAIGVKSG